MYTLYWIYQTAKAAFEYESYGILTALMLWNSARLSMRAKRSAQKTILGEPEPLRRVEKIRGPPDRRVRNRPRSGLERKQQQGYGPGAGQDRKGPGGAEIASPGLVVCARICYTFGAASSFADSEAGAGSSASGTAETTFLAFLCFSRPKTILSRIRRMRTAGMIQIQLGM